MVNMLILISGMLLGPSFGLYLGNMFQCMTYWVRTWEYYHNGKSYKSFVSLIGFLDQIKGGIHVSINTFRKKIVNQYRKRNTWSKFKKKKTKINPSEETRKTKDMQYEPHENRVRLSWRWKWYDVLFWLKYKSEFIINSMQYMVTILSILKRWKM